MLYIFDFDYTLFDTARFKEDFHDLFDELVFDPGDLKIDYFKKNKIHYNIEEHLGLLGENLKDYDHALKILKSFLSDLSKYIFPEVESILIKLNNDNHRLILVSWGNIEWQKDKVYGFGLEKFFEKTLFTDSSKKEVLESIGIKEGEEIIIVNDNVNESLEMMKCIENCKLFLIQGPYSENGHHIVSHQLNEIIDFK
jgi:phosphoglycolate phosphatase-like HAD superfamily hydrolase